MLLISLIGEQPIPILLVDRALRPARHILAYTDRTERVAKNLDAMLPHAELFRLKDAYDMAGIRSAFERKYVPGMVFNLTSGTKPMAWAGYDLARRRGETVVYLQSEKKETRLHRISFAAGKIRQNVEPLPALIQLEDYLSAHGLRIEARLGYSNHQEVALGKFLEGQTNQCWSNVKFPSFEIDFLLRRGNQVAVVEAKETRKGKRFAIDQLTTIAGREHLGTYTGRIWVVKKMPGWQLQDLAQAYRIHIVQVAIREKSPGKWRLDDASAARIAQTLDLVLGAPASG